MAHLTPEQKKWWATLQAMIDQQNVDINNLAALQQVVKTLALEIIRQLPDQDKIVIRLPGDKKGQVLEQFGPGHRFANKADFIKYHERNGAWGEDSLLFPLLNALGYQPFMHLAGTKLPAYLPFEQPTHTQLRIDVVNHGAVAGGVHWTLKGAENPGEGNCMYYTVAQQLQKDFAKVKPLIKDVVPNINKAQEKSLAAKSTLFSAAPTPANNIENIYTKEVAATFASYEAQSNKQYDSARNILEKLDIQTLIGLYQYALTHLVGNDTYLLNRPTHSADEHGNNVMETALYTGNWSAEDEGLLHEELVHALAKEAWRNPIAYKELMNKFATPKQTCKVAAFEEQPINRPGLALKVS